MTVSETSLTKLCLSAGVLGTGTAELDSL